MQELDTKRDLNIFCAISTNRIKEVNDLLLPSLENQTYLGKIILSLVNYKADNTLHINDFKLKNKIMIKILNPNKPTGFGESHNFAFEKMQPEKNFFVMNPDVYLDRNCLIEMLNTFDINVGLIEARQLPFSHPKDKPHQKTFSTNWTSGCCLLINSSFFKKVNGYDPNYWMYLEDVDLSWKSWINKYKVLNNPKAIAYHYTGYYFKYLPTTYALEDYWSMYNFLYISEVYFGKKGLTRALKIISQTSYNKYFIDNIIKAYDKFRENSQIKNIRVPFSLRKRIHIYGYNKFSNC